jgi:4-amino-4-deoxy-L-arabinose transferase-like glycosyltransferase
MILKQHKEQTAGFWPKLAFYSIVFLIIGVLLFAWLGSLLPGYADVEVQAYQQATSLSVGSLIENPVNAPYYLLVKAFSLVSDQGYILVRLVSALIGLTTVAVFFWILRKWFSLRTAVLGTLLFGTSAWLLHTSRLGSPDVLMFLLLALVAAGIWLKRTNNPLVLILCFVLAGLSLYIPGLIWFVIFVVIWEFKQIDFLFKRQLWAVSLGILLFMAIATPLVWAIYRTPELAKSIAGLPAQGWPDLLQVIQNLGLEVPLALFARAPSNPVIWLGNLPVLDIFAAAMFILGAYVFAKYGRLSRAKMFIPVLGLGWILVALGGSVSLSVLLPFIYLVIAGGVGLFIDSWIGIFPRNPIAKALGAGLVGLAVTIACIFQLRSYFIAWPNNTETRAVFTQQSPSSDTIESEQ